MINEQHNRAAPIMRIIPYLDGGALNIDGPLPNTQRGRDAATMVSDGTLTGLSVEMRRGSVKARMVNGVRHITSAELVAAGLVDTSAYEGSTVEVRGRRRSSVSALHSAVGGGMRIVLEEVSPARDAESYTDLEVARLQRRAAGGAASIDETAAVVAGVRAIAAAFSVAMVKPEGLASTLTPPVLRDMATTLLLRGNWVADLEISPFGVFHVAQGR